MSTAFERHKERFKMDSIDDIAATFAIQVYLLSIEVLEKISERQGA